MAHGHYVIGGQVIVAGVAKWKAPERHKVGMAQGIAAVDMLKDQPPVVGALLSDRTGWQVADADTTVAVVAEKQRTVEDKAAERHTAGTAGMAATGHSRSSYCVLYCSWSWLVGIAGLYGQRRVVAIAGERPAAPSTNYRTTEQFATSCRAFLSAFLVWHVRLVMIAGTETTYVLSSQRHPCSSPAWASGYLPYHRARSQRDISTYL